MHAADLHVVYPLLAAGRPSYFCRHKSNKKGFQQIGFFAAQSLYPAKQTCELSESEFAELENKQN
jgi:hypothetical protein